ncbi:hypothetical protein PRO82_001378 [Candidatus Protochlamydia amoebophila]|nr:hypothetical protein [Candidatus Protochlamydia amoebophila]
MLDLNCLIKHAEQIRVYLLLNKVLAAIYITNSLFVLFLINFLVAILNQFSLE